MPSMNAAEFSFKFKLIDMPRIEIEVGMGTNAAPSLLRPR